MYVLEHLSWQSFIKDQIVKLIFKVVWDTLQYFQGWQDSKN